MAFMTALAGALNRHGVGGDPPIFMAFYFFNILGIISASGMDFGEREDMIIDGF